MRPLSLCCSLVAAALATPAFAKLPPLSDEAKIKAAETAARTAWNEKVGVYKLCMTTDRIAAKYGQSGAARNQKPAASSAGAASPGSVAGGTPSALPAVPVAAASPAVPPVSAAAVAAAPPKAPAATSVVAGASPNATASRETKPLVPPATPTGVAVASTSSPSPSPSLSPSPGAAGTVVAAAQSAGMVAPCVDPGPFVPPVAALKPVDAAGAQSPAGAAAVPGTQVAAGAGGAGTPGLAASGPGGSRAVAPSTTLTSTKDKPLEMAEAHSPPGTAIGPPNVRANANQLDTGTGTGTGSGTRAAPATPAGGGSPPAR